MERIEYIIGDEKILREMDKIPAWKPFDDRVIVFLDSLSKMIMQHEMTREYPDLVSLAFFLRKGSIKKAGEAYKDMVNHIGVGTVLHFAPGNIALSFAYSIATGLLTGNTNILRLPSRVFKQADMVCDMLKTLLCEYKDISQRICIIRYPHDKSITDELSEMCHLRVIWGGDETVNTIRQSPIPPRASEITFSNRFSICIINSDNYLENDSYKKNAHEFYIDTYLTDQNACSSPRIVFWMGTRIDEAKDVFWKALSDEIKSYEMAPVTTVNKLLSFCKYASYSRSKMIVETDMKLVRIEIEKADGAVLSNLGNSGFFYECTIESLDEILEICTWQLQTVSCIGIDEKELVEFFLSKACHGVDRVVPVGKTMEFGFVWDGKDVIRQMTREISMK